MNRATSLCLSTTLLGLCAACGRVIVDATNVDDTSGEGGSTTVSGSAATTGGAGGQSIDGGGMCNAPPPPTPTMPNQPGRYFNDNGIGWVAIPCSCDLWMANTLPTPITATIQLTVTPPDQTPTLDGPLDVEIAFDDPDASWYATWAKQTGNGASFTVTHEASTTTVRMGQSTLALLPAPVAACTTRKATAHVFGSSSATLSMHAALESGLPFPTTDATCLNPPPQ